MVWFTVYFIAKIKTVLVDGFKVDQVAKEAETVKSQQLNIKQFLWVNVTGSHPARYVKTYPVVQVFDGAQYQCAALKHKYFALYLRGAPVVIVYHAHQVREFRFFFLYF